MEGKSDESMTVQQSLMFVYGDLFKSKLLATCMIEVHSRQVIYTKAKLDYQSQHTLSLPANRARTVKIYSNKPQIVFESDKSAGKVYKLMPGTVNHVSIFVKVDKP